MESDQNESVKKSAPTTKPTWIQGRNFQWVLRILLGAAAFLLVFQLGQYVGYRKARFSYGFGDNYRMVFGSPADAPGREPPGGFMNGHGVTGAIAGIDGMSLVVKGSRGTEAYVVMTDRTSIVKGRSRIGATELKIRDFITAIGRPQENGAMAAEIIRVFPHPAAFPNP